MEDNNKLNEENKDKNNNNDKYIHPHIIELNPDKKELVDERYFKQIFIGFSYFSICFKSFENY